MPLPPNTADSPQMGDSRPPSGSPSSDTPETDEWMMSTTDFVNTCIPHARKLERQLNKAREQMAYLSQRWEQSERERDEGGRSNKQWRYEWDQLREDFKAMMATRNSDPSYSLDEALDQHLGHANVETTEIYTHANGSNAVISPMDYPPIPQVDIIPFRKHA